MPKHSVIAMHFASERSKHAKHRSLMPTGGEPTNIPYAATKAKLSLSKRPLLAASVFCIPTRVFRAAHGF